MSTTTLVVDLLITGLQVSIWLALLTCSIFGVEWAGATPFMGGDEAVLLVLLIPIAYPLGVFIDDGADRLLGPWQRALQERHLPGERYPIYRLLALTQDAVLSTNLDYMRSRIRTSRSSALNFALITLCGVAFTLAQLGLRWKLVAFELALGSVATGLAVATWHRVTVNLYRRVKFGLESHPRPARTAEVPAGDAAGTPADANGVLRPAIA